MENFLTNFKINDETQTIAELWASVAELANAKVEENAHSENYNKDIGEQQAKELKILLDVISKTHKKMHCTFLIGETIKLKRLTFNPNSKNSRFGKKDFYVATRTNTNIFTPTFDIIDDRGDTRPVILSSDFTSVSWKMID